MKEYTTISKRHWKLKELAQKLRAQGLSYKEIAKQVPVAKSTISLWCRHVPLSNSQLKRLWEKHDNQFKGIQAIQKMFWDKRCEAFNTGLTSLSKPTNKGRFLAGLMLYWAEGTKHNSTAISNSDPRVIKFMVNWLHEFYAISSKSLVIHLHLHSGQNEQDVKQYWSKLTGIPLKNFQKSFIKQEGSGYRKNVLYNGTAKLRVKGNGSTYLLFRILGSLAGFLQFVLNEKARPENWMTVLPHAQTRVVSSIGRAGRS